MSRIVICLSLLVGCMMFPACERKPPVPGAGSGKVSVFVSILPQEYFVARVGGEHVVVEALVRPGQSPHNFSATAAQMTRLGESRIYFTIGVPFEKTIVGKIAESNPGLKIVDTREGIALRRMRSQHDHEGDEHLHEAGEADPHVWLNPRNVIIMAGHICAALKESDPAHAAEYDRNLASFVSDLKATDKRIAKALAPLKGAEFMVFHPAFGYFADAYGLRQLPVEIEGKDPSAKALARLMERARKERIRVIFVQPAFSDKRARMIADEIGGAVVPMDPLARDYLTNLEDMAQQVEAALGER